MGDVIHSTIIATAIKQKHPDWQVDFLSTSYYADIIKTHPHIDNVIYFDATKRKSYTYLFKMALDLFKTRYDIIFNLTRAMRNNLLARLAFPKKYKGKMCFETSWVEEYFLTAKSVIRDIELPKRLYINLPDIDFDRVDNIINDCPKPYIIISPGGATDVSRQGRIWSLEKWKELNLSIDTVDDYVEVEDEDYFNEADTYYYNHEEYVKNTLKEYSLTIELGE